MFFNGRKSKVHSNDEWSTFQLAKFIMEKMFQNGLEKTYKISNGCENFDVLGSDEKRIMNWDEFLVKLVRICLPLKKPIVYWLLDIPLNYTLKIKNRNLALTRCYSGFQASTKPASCRNIFCVLFMYHTTSLWGIYGPLPSYQSEMIT